MILAGDSFSKGLMCRGYFRLVVLWQNWPDQAGSLIVARATIEMKS